MALLPVFLLLTAQVCPPQESIYPCSCQRSSYGVSVHCKNIETEVTMERVLVTLRDYKLHQLTISGFNASTLRPDAFKGLHIEELCLDRIEADDASFRPFRRHFQGLEGSLKELDIRSSFSSRGLSEGLQLDHLLKLQVVIFNVNNIPEVDNYWFNGGPSSLSKLEFMQNGIEILGDKAFRSLSNLKIFSVHGNHILELKRSMFPEPANNLQDLDLSFNNLRELPTDLFSEMPSLLNIRLVNNLIHLMDEKTFSFVLLGKAQVNVMGNPLECSESLRWVCKTRNYAVFGECSIPGGSYKKNMLQFCEDLKTY